MDNSQLSPFRVLLKAVLLLMLIALIFGFINSDAVGKLSLYNYLFPGRERLPFGENQQQAYNLSLYNIPAMFASHEVNSLRIKDNYYDVFLLGDSSVWGTLLHPNQTLDGQLNALNLTICGRPARFHNLGYPTLSLTKDLMLLDEAMRYSPDQIVWLTTLESFPRETQLSAPILANNPSRTLDLISRFNLNLNTDNPVLVKPDFLKRSLLGQRRNLADLVRLQLYGVMWAATGIDQTYPENYEHAATDLEPDQTFHGRQPPNLDPNTLALNVLDAGIKRAGNVPVLIVNEPILISHGLNSYIRYNFFYPRWAYDQYRSFLASHVLQNGWSYLDLWDIVPPGEFTNSAIHLTSRGEQILAEHLAEELKNTCTESKP